MKKYDIESTKGVWTKFPDDEEVSLLLRPFTLFSFTKMPSDDSFNIKEFWSVFDYCVLDWKGFVNAEDKVLECNTESKRMVFDYDQDIVLFVISETSKLRDSIVTEKELKNLSTSQPGETKKQEK